MGIGGTRRTTARYGLRTLRRAGLPIMTAAGLGWNHGAGPGLTMHPGASLRSIMDVGLMPITAGDGTPARLRRVPTTLPRWSPLSVVEDSVWVCRLAVAVVWSGGFRWARAKFTTPLITFPKVTLAR